MEGFSNGVNRLATGLLSEEKVSEIRDRSSILEVVSDYVTLKKTGKNYKGLCPFHSEKTPSFMVNEEKQIFHCFGCGEGGDVFTFLMKAGHFSFPQAMEELAKRYGIKLPARELSPTQKKEIAKREVLFQINQIASEHFHDLLTQRREGGEGRKYLSQRGISQEVIEEHGLGYSADRWDGLVRHLQEKKVSLELAWELGLIFPKKREGRYDSISSWYDAFRGRILFPIFDLHQRIVGFGGRVLKEEEPKYLNSPESSIYHKGEVLYGLQVAKRYATEKDCVIIVEGYFDLLTLHQYGLKHSVATLGTALTPQQIRTLKRYTKNLITLFDADRAGVQATLRSLPLFLEEEVVGKTIVLPKGEDPDGFLRKGNLEDLVKRVEHAMPLVDFFFERLMETYDVKSVDGRVRIAKEGVALLNKIPDRIRRGFYTKALAERLDVKESFLYEVLRSSSKEPFKAGEDSKKSSVERAFPKSEEIVVRLMVHHPEVIPTLSEEGIIKEFQSLPLQKVAGVLEDLYIKEGKIDLPKALSLFEEDLKKWLYDFAFQENGLEKNREKILKDCVQKIREERIKKEKGDLQRKIKEVDQQQEDKGLHLLLKQKLELARKREKGLQKESFRKG